MDVYQIPDGLPVLSRGKHRSARKGACFMEMASVLANEPWSDHPRCTHPLIGHLARLVNDHTSDRHRGELAVMIPSVVGLHGGGLAWMVDVTAAVALDALDDVPAPSQRALVAGLVRCEEMGTRLPPGAVENLGAVREALQRFPGPVVWVRRLSGGSTITAKQFEKRSAPNVMRCAVGGLTMSTVPDPDARLRELLHTGITTGQRLAPTPAPARSDLPSTQDRATS